MPKRLAAFSSLVVGLLFLSGDARAAGEKFEIVSVTYTDINGQQQTKTFNAMNKIAHIPAAAVQNDIIVNGTYGPANAAVASTISVSLLGVELASAPANCKNGAWTMKIVKNTLSTNTFYDVASSKMGLPATATVNGVNVAVTAKSLVIAINN
jgi:hypothetical protein